MYHSLNQASEDENTAQLRLATIEVQSERILAIQIYSSILANWANQVNFSYLIKREFVDLNRILTTNRREHTKPNTFRFTKPPRWH